MNGMNWRAIMAIVWKDIKVLSRTKGVVLPLLIVPLFFTVFFPAIFASLPQLTRMAGLPQPVQGINDLFRHFPAGFQAELAAYLPLQRMVVLMVVYYFAPMYLILPLMVSSVVAADSIAGEKERRTMEALLYTPTSDQELFVAKLLASWLPALVVAWGGFIVYSLVVNIAAWPTFHYIFFPTAMWWLLALWVAPAVAGVGLGCTVLISARVNTFQEAYQLGGLVVLPVVALMVSQGAGALYLGPLFVFLLGLAAWVLDAGLLWFGMRALRRNSLLARI
jgi:ABC-type transport system involved in multi-copper enzyme maturation permease subunit